MYYCDIEQFNVYCLMFYLKYMLFIKEFRKKCVTVIIDYTKTVRRELHGIFFHGRAAASKPYITKSNAKLCKAHCH